MCACAQKSAALHSAWIPLMYFFVFRVNHLIISRRRWWLVGAGIALTSRLPEAGPACWYVDCASACEEWVNVSVRRLMSSILSPATARLRSPTACSTSALVPGSILSACSDSVFRYYKSTHRRCCGHRPDLFSGDLHRREVRHL